MDKTTLRGWKAIASFLDVSVKTAARWEAELGMPVHRFAGTKGETVYAEPDELTRWMQERQTSRQADELRDDDDRPLSGMVPGERDAPGEDAPRRAVATRWIVAGFVVIATLSLAAALYSKAVPGQDGRRSAPPQPKADQSEVMVVTSSGVVSVLRVTIGQVGVSTPVTVGIFDGGMATLAFERNTSIGLLARRDDKQLLVLVAVLGGNLAGPGNSIHQIGTLHLDPHRPVAIAHEGTTLTVEWIDTRPGKPATSESSPGRARECTIRCDRLAVTSAFVETPCGRCCDPTACGARPPQ